VCTDLNWAGQMTFSQARGKVCRTTAGSCGWSQYVQQGLATVVGEWADAIDLNSPATTDIDDPGVRADLASLLADQVSLFESTPGTTGHYYWTVRQGSGWDPRPNASLGAQFVHHQLRGTAWNRSLQAFRTRACAPLSRRVRARQPSRPGVRAAGGGA
jgi:hypothetical protein